MLKVMDENPDIYIISVGLGWPRTDEFSTLYPQRFIQTEASEQTALDIAVGLSYSGKIPIVYTISSFYWRAAETIRTYINREKLKVIMVGAGKDGDYSDHGDGFSHDARDIPELFNIFKNITQFYPNDKNELIDNINSAIALNGTSFVNIHR